MTGYYSLDNISLNDKLADRVTATLYGVLGELYNRELDMEFAQELNQIGFLQALNSIDPGFSMNEFLNSLDFEVFAEEFARLFLGPGPLVPPYGSVHRKDDKRPGQLWGSTTGEVKRFIELYGLKLEIPGTIPDHISVMFEFMQRLILAKIDAFERNDDEAYYAANKIQQQFFNDYIEPWVVPFLEKIKRAKPLPFYSAVAELTIQLIRQQKS